MLISVLIFAIFSKDIIKLDDVNDDLNIKDDLVVDTNHFHLLAFADQ